MDANRELHNAHLHYQRMRLGGRLPDDVNESMRRGTHFVKPALSALIIWRSMSDDYRRLFCEHGKGMFSECGACRRTKREAQANFSRLCAGAHTAK